MARPRLRKVTEHKQEDDQTVNVVVGRYELVVSTVSPSVQL